MYRLPIGTIYNTATTRVSVAARAVGFFIDAAVLPIGLKVQNDNGEEYAPRRGEMVQLKSRGHYTFIYPDTWAGNIDSVFGQIATYEIDYDVTKKRLGGGEIYAIFFENDAEMKAYIPPRTLAPVFFIPKMQGIAVGESWQFSNLDFGAVEVRVRVESAGYYATFFVYTGARPGAVNQLNDSDVIAYATAITEGSTDVVRPRLSVQGLNNLGLICFQTDIAGNEEIAVAFKFLDKQQARRVEGESIICGDLTMNASTETLDLPLPAAIEYCYNITNTGANNVTSAGVDALHYSPIAEAYLVGGSVLNDATLTPGEGGITKQAIGSHAIRWRGTCAAAGTMSWSVYLYH